MSYNKIFRIFVAKETAYMVQYNATNIALYPDIRYDMRLKCDAIAKSIIYVAVFMILHNTDGEKIVLIYRGSENGKSDVRQRMV